MTREEAIVFGKRILSLSLFDETHEFCELAVKALEQQPCDDWYDVPSDEMTIEQARQAVNDLRKKLAGYLEQQHCYDAISRQAVLDLTGKSDWFESSDDYNDFVCAVCNLPPVTPQQENEDIAKAFQFGLAFGFAEKYDEMDKVLEEVKKAVTPQPKMGKWEQTRYRSIDQTGESYDDGIGFRCSNCANVFKVTSLARYHFCPNCGAKMQEVEET